MNFKDAEEYIHSLTRFGSQLGLTRMEKLLEMLSNPQNKLRFIHIAGTNGKGTTANFCANILMRAGYTVGVYTSPFVDDFRERFQINGKMISMPLFGKLAERVKTCIEAMSESGLQVTEFEAITAISFLYFAQLGCDIVCLEVGLGGRLDATNIIGTPEVAVITSISYDHTEILGDTIEKIAFEKAGIIKENTTVVTYPLQNEAALAVLREQCAKTNSTLVVPDAKKIEHLRRGNGMMKFDYCGHYYCIKMLGDHQAYNAVAAITVMEELVKKGFAIKPIDMHLGMYDTKVPARFELVSLRKPHMFIDGAHNMEAIKAFATSMKTVDAKKKIVIMGMMVDKEYTLAVKEIAASCDAFIAVDVANPRAADKQLLQDVAKEHCTETYAFAKHSDAVKKAVELAGDAGVIFGCGSFYLMGDLREAMVAEYRAQKKLGKLAK